MTETHETIPDPNEPPKVEEAKKRDYETQYMETFVKEINFPFINHSSMVINPRNTKLLYTLTKCGVAGSTIFEGVVPNKVDYEMMAEDEYEGEDPIEEQ
jgi:hypothetical protein